MQPDGTWPSWASTVGLGADLWRWSPARIFDARRSAPLLVYHSRDDGTVEPGQAHEMVRRGARAVWLRGDHLADQRWRPTVVGRLLAATRR